MKTFPSGFAAEIAKRSGLTPVWILKCPFASTGTLYLSDMALPIASWEGGITTTNWINRWGQVDEDISQGQLAMPQVAQFSADAIVDHSAASSIKDILWTAANNVETVDCELYLWFYGLDPATDPPQLVWAGNITDFEEADEITYKITFSDISVQVNKYIGTKISRDAFPYCLDKAVGAVQNIVYGKKKVPWRCVKGHIRTTLAADMAASGETKVYLSDNPAAWFVDVAEIRIDGEEMLCYTPGSDAGGYFVWLYNSSESSRAQNGTIAAAHSAGAAVTIASPYTIFQIAGHAVKSINRDYSWTLDPFLIANTWTVYSGQSGDELTGYEGTAVGVLAMNKDTSAGVPYRYKLSWCETAENEVVLSEVEGYFDDASGTITGTASALIERPDHVFKHLLNTFAGRPLAAFYTNADSQFSSKGYTLPLVISEYKQLKEWLAAMAWQCRCYFRFAGGKDQLLWRPDSLTSAKTISDDLLRGNDDGTTKLTVTRGELTNIINQITALYDRNWLESGDTAYAGLYKTSDATSIARYGEYEQPSLFQFDFVTDAAMAQDLADFYLARYKDRKQRIQVTAYLHDSDVEFGDAITLSDHDNLVIEVKKANMTPTVGDDGSGGNASEIDTVTFLGEVY